MMSPWLPTVPSATKTFRARARPAATCWSVLPLRTMPPHQKAQRDLVCGGIVRSGNTLQHNATAHQVALRFLVRWPPLFAIPKAANPAHAAENAGAGDLGLTQADLARIEEAFPR